MRQSTRFFSLRFLSTLFLANLLFMPTVGHGDSPSRKPAVTGMNVHFGTGFFENRGQIVTTRGEAATEVKYYAFVKGARLYVTPQGWYTVFASREKEDEKAVSEATGDAGREAERSFDPNKPPEGARLYRIGTMFEGSMPDVEIVASEKVPEYHNFYLAHCPDGITKVPGYRELRYVNLYNNIDLILHASRDGMKWEFEVRPGGRVEDIRLRYDGAENIEAMPDGSLLVRWPEGYIKEQRPFTYRPKNDVSDAVEATSSSYRLNGNSIEFEVAEHDENSVQVIDPFSTYFGGTHDEISNGISVDPRNFLAVVGITSSFDFPVLNAWQDSLGRSPGPQQSDAFLLQCDSNTTLRWATFFGGEAAEFLISCATDSINNIAICGSTQSGDLPVDASAFQKRLNGDQDGFIAKIDSSGSRIWATYFGGSSNENIFGIGTDPAGNIIASGGTESWDLPTFRAGQSMYKGERDFFYLKMTTSGNLIFSSYLGGIEREGLARVDVDASGYFALAGSTQGDMPVKAAQQPSFGGGVSDDYLAFFDSSGVMQWATFIGGSGTESGSYEAAVRFDHHRNILLSGSTRSTDLPVSRAFQSANNGVVDAYLMKYSQTGALIWGTYYGGNSYDNSASKCAVDNQDNIYLVGRTRSRNFPIFNAVYPSMKDPVSISNPSDAFIVKFDSAGARLWATYLGGSLRDWINGAVCDSRDYLFALGTTYSHDFPIINAWQDTLKWDPNSIPTNQDIFITRFDPDGTIPVTLSALTAARVANGVELNWRTESEVNAYGFSIERNDAGDQDGGQVQNPVQSSNYWENIGFVQARGGDNTGQFYTWLDASPGREDLTSFYRLRMIDNDGSYEYSPVVEVGPIRALNQIDFEAVYPDPARDWLTLRFSLPTEQSVTLIVHDVSGRELARLHDGELLPSGEHTSMLPVASWPSGLYLFTLSAGEMTITRRGLILR